MGDTRAAYFDGPCLCWYASDMVIALTARPATLVDYDHYVRLFPELGVDDPVKPRERWEQALLPETLFFEESGAVVAYVYVQVLNGTGYVRHVIVDPSRQGQGLGRTVMEIIAGRLREAGCVRWCLNVKPDNTPAVRLYQRVGMKRTYTMTAFRLYWDVVERLPRGDRAVVARPMQPKDDAAIESAFGLPSGQIAAVRTKGGWILLRLVDPARPEDNRLGFAAFSPTFPGAFPFRVGHPTLAAPLLDAIHSHALAEPPYTQVVVEDDDALVEALTDVGATVRLVAFHMEGDL